jgi:hypothetical protein
MWLLRTLFEVRDPSNSVCWSVMAFLMLSQVSSDFVEREMRLQDPEGFAIWGPTVKKIHCTPLVVLGPHYEWSGNGHDKLASIGFLI